MSWDEAKWKEQQAEKLRQEAEQEDRLLSILKKYPKLEVSIPFSCGGDSMNDLYVEFSQKEGVPQEALDSIESIVEGLVYDRVEFYVNSDGHYIGEAGTVTLELDEEGINWYKDAESEYSESVWLSPEIDLLERGFTKEEVAYLKENIAGVLKTDWGDDILFRGDVILYEEEHALMTRFHNLIQDLGNELYEKAVAEGEKTYGIFEPNDEYSISTADGMDISPESELEIENEILTVYYEVRGYVCVPSYT